MLPDRLQLQRFELKYLIPPYLVESIRSFVRGYLELDDYCEKWPGQAYPIHSVYLDSEDLALYWSTINGDKNRFKLRVRYYDDDPKGPAFLEIKRRSNEAILKQRGAVRRDAVARLLAGEVLGPGDLLNPVPRQIIAVQNFQDLVFRIGARPQTHVAYLREAWLSAGDNSVRVTFDHAVQTEAVPAVLFNTRMEFPKAVFPGKVILEIKFTGRFPGWLAEMVRAFGLERRSAAKYADGLLLMTGGAPPARLQISQRRTFPLEMQT